MISSIKMYGQSGEYGAATLLLLAVLLPLFLFLLTITVEMNSFLAQRQLVQENLDQLARRVLRSALPVNDINRILAESIKSQAAFVKLQRLSSTRNPAQAELKAEFSYTTTFGGVYPQAKEIKLLEVPFALTSRVTRVPYDLMVLTDRSIQSSETPCTSAQLKQMNEFSRTLYLRAGANGAAAIIAGVMDPVSNEVVRLDTPAVGDTSGLFCSGDIGYSPVEDLLSAIEGVSQYPKDKAVFVNSVQEVLFQERPKTPARKQIVILLTRGFDDRWSGLKDLTFSLQQNAEATGLIVSVSRVIVGDVGTGSPKCSIEWQESTSPHITSRCVSVQSGAQLDGSLLTALLGEAGEAVLDR